MPDKSKRKLPSLGQPRILNRLALSTRLEIKVNLSLGACTDYLAKMLPAKDRDKRCEYVFKMGKNPARKRFTLNKNSLGMGGKGPNRDAYLIGELKEEPNLDVTTITVKIYPDLSTGCYGLILSIFMVWMIFGVPQNGVWIVIAPCCGLGLFLLFFALTIFGTIASFEERNALKTYFLSRLEAVSIKSAPKLSDPTP
ncbi:MAG TPA: hypothetical protein VHL11_24430 [Phototrophicaceae bacterium]|jgi:hypothetical protein|nr:hypothetical protein [Phototrophicaceae bacterium]